MAEAPVVADVNQASPLSLSMQFNTLWGKTNMAKNSTIFRTPHIISQNRNKNLFEPSAISIGPFHRGREHLCALEKQKWQFLHAFLSRGDHISLDLCISEMKLLEKRTRSCYSETFDDFSSNAFVEMMLLDGCFVLEFYSQMFKNGSTCVDEVGWNSIFILFDLLLLENQIPFFIVEKLYEIGNLNQEEHITIFVKCLVSLILCTGLTKDIGPIISDCPTEIQDEFPDPKNYICSIIPDPPTEIHHLAHLCYHYLVPNPEKPVVLRSKSIDLVKIFCANRIIKGLLHWFRSRVLRGRSPHLTSRSLLAQLLNSTGNISSMVIPSATELKQKGLKFIPKRNSKHMLDISFEYGVLKIPRLTIGDHTKPLFSNLIAFEHSKHGQENRPFTTFVAFFNNLVNTPNDVTILQECGIIENWLGSEEEVAHFINQATENNYFESDHYLAELYMEVNRYIGSSCNRHRAKLIRDYFSNPWAAISLVAALILLVLTFAQSFFAVFAYFHPPKP